jgi:hypothetical protein
MANLKEVLTAVKLEKKTIALDEGTTADVYLRDLSYGASFEILKLGKTSAKESNIIMVREMVRDESGNKIFTNEELENLDSTIFMELLKVCDEFIQKKTPKKQRTFGTN